MVPTTISPMFPRPNALAMAASKGVPVVDIVVPVYNEQTALEGSIRRLHRYVTEALPYTARITIADNASVDDTPRVAAQLAAELVDVRVVRLEQKGRGRALHTVWSASDSPVLAYMTSTCPPTLPRWSRCSRLLSPDTPTWPSAPAWPGVRASCVARSGR